ncbi:hypothetical protein BOX15_Mlig023953g1 [Macrostomum lignano]|uniref:Peptidase S54 rhomboid domain-containing protein n=1 Tax=Macrostomum lignano TaxID=282301 RepID=A0A267FK24_9PLAT|nr:hypothetical protein BOX15_Mlig023953g1 [Macrostomum lignano]
MQQQQNPDLQAEQQQQQQSNQPARASNQKSSFVQSVPFYLTDFHDRNYTDDDLIGDLEADLARYSEADQVERELADKRQQVQQAKQSWQQVQQAKQSLQQQKASTVSVERRRRVQQRQVSHAETRTAAKRLAEAYRLATLLHFLKVEMSREGEAKILEAAVSEELGCRHRPYFTLWITGVHVILFAVSLLMFGIVTPGINTVVHQDKIVKDRHNFKVKMCTIDYPNFLIGPRLPDLVRLGAKYGPCMRRYSSLYRDVLDRLRLDEAASGCCIHNDGSACYQSDMADCPEHLGTWLKWDNASRGPDGRLSGPVCGADPRTCDQPLSLLGGGVSVWADDVTRWPACQRQTPLAPVPGELNHLACPVSARPCCFGLIGECAIVSRLRCQQLRGFYHPDSQLCSQVNCLADACGMLGFSNLQQPNQFYRLATSQFLHAGLATLLVTLLHHGFYLRRLERLAGWRRTACLYFGCGLSGCLLSAIALPAAVDVGPAAAQVGSLAAVLVEYITAWPYVESRVKSTALLLLCLLILLLLGVSPWLDLFSSVGGFVAAVCCALPACCPT